MATHPKTKVIIRPRAVNLFCAVAQKRLRRLRVKAIKLQAKTKSNSAEYHTLRRRILKLEMKILDSRVYED
jgi:hypothetical protein